MDKSTYILNMPTRFYSSITAFEFKEKVMVNEFPTQHWDDEMERNAYNAAFHELGFRWYWDSDTFNALMGQSSNPSERIHHYLTTRQPHLLKAYDAPFLVGVIQEKKAQYGRRKTASAATACRHFDWAETLGCELGA
jgi:hypothetical protein